MLLRTIRAMTAVIDSRVPDSPMWAYRLKPLSNSSGRQPGTAVRHYFRLTTRGLLLPEPSLLRQTGIVLLLAQDRFYEHVY